MLRRLVFVGKFFGVVNIINAIDAVSYVCVNEMRCIAKNVTVQCSALWEEYNHRNEPHFSPQVLASTANSQPRFRSFLSVNESFQFSEGSVAPEYIMAVPLQGSKSNLRASLHSVYSL